LSGFFVPIANMPIVVQWLTYLNPLRYFIEVVRGVVLKGSGISALWPETLEMAVYGILVLSLATWRFRKSVG